MQKMAAVKRRHLEQALTASRHNQKAAARWLGLTCHQFRSRMRKHGVG